MDIMDIKISPNSADSGGFLVHVNGWSTGAKYKTYDDAVRVANAIADGAIHSGVVSIDYSECLESLTA